MVKVADLPSFDMAESLKTEEDIVMYLNMVLEENDPAELAHALGVIAKARGMTQIAKEAGIGREALYKALRHDSAPRFDTINRVVNALGGRGIEFFNMQFNDCHQVLKSLSFPGIHPSQLGRVARIMMPTFKEASPRSVSSSRELMTMWGGLSPFYPIFRIFLTVRIIVMT